MAEAPRLLDQVRERDLDLVLLSALFVSESFREFMIHSIIGWTGGHSFVKARVSEMADAGETDVLLVVDLDSADRLGMMIEDKIGAHFQPVQADRYRQRGKQGVRDGQWHRFATCLCAPEGYLAVARAANEWDAYVSFESISAWAGRSDDRLLAFVGAICGQAIAKREDRLREVSPEATAFWRAYRQLAADLLPEVGVTRLASSISAASPWPRFGASSLPANMFVEHKPQQGRVDLTFDKMSLGILKLRLPAALPFDIRPMKTSGSAALRIAVPRIDHLRSFDVQQDEVLAAFAAVERLLTIGLRMASTIFPP